MKGKMCLQIDTIVRIFCELKLSIELFATESKSIQSELHKNQNSIFLE